MEPVVDSEHVSPSDETSGIRSRDAPLKELDTL